MKATSGTGNLEIIKDIIFEIGGEKADIYAVPEISESKSAKYNDIGIMGRSTPLKSYSYSDNKSIDVTFFCHSIDAITLEANKKLLRMVRSSVYPVYSGYVPPKVGYLKIFDILENDIVGNSYSLTYGNQYAWKDEQLPIYMEIRANFHAVWPHSDLPGFDDIISGDKN